METALILASVNGTGDSHRRRSNLPHGIRNIFHVTDFSKWWASNDVIFLVEEQRLHVHRWILELRGEDKTEIALPGKKSLQVQELTLMVYFLAERPMIIKNCFFFFEARWWIPNGISSGSICAGRLSIHEYLLGFSPLSSKLKKEQVLELIISAQEFEYKNGQAFSRLLTRSSIC